MTKISPALYGYSIENIKQKIEDIKALGYTQEEIIKMTKILPAIYSLSIENIKQKVEDLKELGYTQEEVIKMTKSFSGIYSHSIESIKQKIEDLKELGYTQKEIIKMTKSLPSIYSLSIESIKQKIEGLKEIGYTEEEVIKMTISLPTIYGYSIENIKRKIDFYNSIGLSFLPIKNTIKLMQSTELSYARYKFYKARGITIDRDNYIKLFVRQKQFEKQYGITKAELLKMYPYPVHKDVKEFKEETKEEQKDVVGKDEITDYLQNMLKELKSKDGQAKE